MADFNPSCAAWVHDTISKMDDGEAEAFALLLVDDLWSRDMEANARYVRAHQERQDQVYTQDVAKALLEHLETGGDPQEAVAVAAAVAVAKADHDAWKFQARDQGGRFGRMTGAQYRANMAAAKAGAKAQVKARRAEYLSSSNEHGGLYGDVAGAGRGVVGAARFAAGSEGFNRAPGESGATDTFNRLSTGGQLVQQLGAATGSNKTAIAGAVANYAGKFGPEAEKVVGPSMRRAAYRYRGTERTPDRQYLYLAQQNLNGIKRGTTATPAEKSFAAELSAVQYFQGGAVDGRKGKARIPSPSLAGLHRASGRVTPSEGILIDAQGNVKHQAVGYGEDHYLPFNLKNLSALKGGSYVRTRESGGLTTEDIYTGLVSGARSMTVVSNSGTFTVDFADDLRGGRRYNDKARQMVKRYGQTLDAIQSEQVANPERSMSSWEKAHLRVEAEKKINSDPLLSTFSAKEKDAWVEAEVQRAEQSPKLSAKDIEQIESKAREQGKTVSEQQVLARQMYDEKSATLNQRNYRLDGQGYATALDALREQFPYYIGEVHYQHVESNDTLAPGRYNRATDQGYVKPRFNRPAGARAGYFDESIEGRGKRGADRTGYQNLRARGQRDTPGEATAETPKAAPKGETPDEARTRMAGQVKQKEEAAKYGQKVRDDARNWIKMDEEESGAFNLGKHDTIDTFRDLSPEDQDRFLSDPEKSRALEKDLDDLDKLHSSRFKNAADLPTNRKDFKRKAARSSVATVVSGASSPVAPPAIEDKAAFEAKQDPVFLDLLRGSDADLRAHSDKLRAQREQSPGESRKQFDAAITRVETARAVKAQGPAEVSAEEYESEVERRTAGSGTLTKVPTVGPSKDDAVTKRIEMLRIAHERGQVTTQQFHDDARDLLTDSGMDADQKARLYRNLTGNVLR